MKKRDRFKLVGRVNRLDVALKAACRPRGLASPERNMIQHQIPWLFTPDKRAGIELWFYISPSGLNEKPRGRVGVAREGWIHAEGCRVAIELYLWWKSGPHKVVAHRRSTMLTVRASLIYLEVH